MLVRTALRRMNWLFRAFTPYRMSFGRTISTCIFSFKTIWDLKTALLKEWQFLPHWLINHLISSMDSYCENGSHFFVPSCNHCFISSTLICHTYASVCGPSLFFYYVYLPIYIYNFIKKYYEVSAFTRLGRIYQS